MFQEFIAQVPTTSIITHPISEYNASYSILEEPSTEIEVYPDFDTSLEPEIDSEWDTEFDWDTAFDSGVEFGI